MKKRIIIGLSGLAFMYAVSSPASAQTGEAPQPKQSQSQPKPAPATQTEQTGPTDNQIVNDVDARIAWLKAELRLTPDQEKNWSSLQTALHDYGIGQLRSLIGGRSASEDRRDRDDRPNDLALMRDEATQLTLRAVSLQRLADAAEPLYGGLDNHQKHRLIQFMRTEFEIDRRQTR
jgi:LTXXQ motif family protein